MKKIHALLLKLETYLLSTLLISTILIAVGQIILRNLLDIGLFWAESTLRVSVLWVVLLGAMLASRENEHIAIDFFVHKMNAKTKRFIKKLTDLFSALLCFIMAYYSVIFVQSEYQEGSLAFAFIPNWFCEAIIPFTFFIIAIRYLTSALFLMPKVTQ